MGKTRVMIVLSLILAGAGAWSQDPGRFREEVEKLVLRNDSLWDNAKETIVFTGSSSIRTWDSLQSDFPDYQIINSGFGGSHASDLMVYMDKLILRYNPSKVFIYEGDNDLSMRKRPGKILKDIEVILSKIWSARPDTEIILISAKPSISRWGRRRAFKRLNRRYRRMASRIPNLDFIDIWNPMLKGRKLNEDLYIEDGLHMNQKGYRIWKEVIKPYVK